MRKALIFGIAVALIIGIGFTYLFKQKNTEIATLEQQVQEYKEATTTGEPVKSIKKTKEQTKQEVKQVAYERLANAFMPKFLDAYYESTDLKQAYKKIEPMLRGEAKKQFAPIGEQGVEQPGNKTASFTYRTKVLDSSTFFHKNMSNTSGVIVSFYTLETTLNQNKTTGNYVIMAELSFNSSKNDWELSYLVENKQVNQDMSAAYFGHKLD
ncbi:hypothetical protein HCA99_16675 [Listeria booriae]|uniref:hypothetical protein n=1 Tax=Listeria booriae TaxID=1552123 RepID=UPI001623CBF5|nr:hypothetical protein [Listeria booriae]MBC2080867.1 hypothetical protein [Listeria booriae]